MKKYGIAVAAVLILLLFGCGQGRDQAVEHKTEEPVVLGDENSSDFATKQEDHTGQEFATKQESHTGQEFVAKREDHTGQQAVTDRHSGAEWEDISGREAAAEGSGQTEQEPVEGPLPVLTSAPEDIVMEDFVQRADGSYAKTSYCMEGSVRLLEQREKNVTIEASSFAVQEYFSKTEGWQEDAVVQEDDVLSQTAGFPVYRYRCTTGEGEESVMHNGRCVVLDGCILRIDASAEASDYPDLEEQIETIFTDFTIKK